MDSIRRALKAYRIEPVKIDQITERLFRIYDGQHVFALKKSRLTKEGIANWENTYHQAYSQNIPGVLSVFLTERGLLYEEINGEIFYITPWLESTDIEQKQEIEMLYRGIGIVHAKTKQSISNNAENIIVQFKKYQEFCLSIKSNLLVYVEKFEKNRYMSPFELLVCTQYRDLELVSVELNKRVEQFIDNLEDQSVWNYCLCHGQLHFSHVIHGEHTYITNWEKAHFDNATVDLSVYHKDLVKYYDQPTEQLIDLFSVYTNENSLTNSELYLLSIYLLDPSNYIKILNQYTDNKSNGSMIHQIIGMQHAYRQLLFALKWSEHVDNLVLSNPIDDSES